MGAVFTDLALNQNNQKEGEHFMNTKTDKAKTAARKLSSAELAHSPSVASALITSTIGKSTFTEINIAESVKLLCDTMNEVKNGDMSAMESMLVGQAHALQTMFVALVNRAQCQDYLKQYGTYMGLALKAQAQSRATIQALTELKYPRQVIVTKQANISNGHQQVINGKNSPVVRGEAENFPTNTHARMHAPTPAKQIQNTPNEVLEVSTNPMKTRSVNHAKIRKAK